MTETTTVAPAARHPRWRRILGTVLLVIAILLVPISLSAIWVRTTLLNTDRYVATVGPLASNPEVQQALATDITNAIFTRVDVNKAVTDALPKRGGFLAAPITNTVKTATDAAALKLVSSDRFQTLWKNANRRAHAGVVKVLTGGGPRVSTANGTVAININQIFENVKERLDQRGITVFQNATLPADKQEFVIFQSKDLVSAQGAVNLLQKLAWVLPLFSLLLFAAAIGLSGRRRRTVERAAIASAIVVAVELAFLKAGRNFYLDAITSRQLPKGAAGAVWDQLTNGLRVLGIVVIVVALLIALFAFFTTTTRRATAARRLATMAPYVARSKAVYRGLGIALALVVLIVWSNPSAVAILVVAILLVLYLLAIEYLGRVSVTADKPTSAVT